MMPSNIVPRYEPSPGRKSRVTHVSPNSSSPESILLKLQQYSSPPALRSSSSPTSSSPSPRHPLRPTARPSRNSPSPSSSPRSLSPPRKTLLAACKHSWCGGGRNPHECELRLNVASEEAVFAFFNSVPGLGLRTANRVLAVREEDGVFVSPSDFDRRVPRLTWERLLALTTKCGLGVTLARKVRAKPAPPPPGTTPSEIGSDLACSIAATFIPDPDAPMIPLCEDPIRLASWNAGHFSMKSKFLNQKLGHLVRFMEDSADVAVLSLQEVYGDMPRFISRRFAEKLKGRWGTLSPEGDVEPGRSCFEDSLMQAFVYNSSRLDARNITGVIPEALLKPFLRRPVVGLFSFKEPRASGGQYFALVNVHLSVRYKESEVQFLPEVMNCVQEYVKGLGGEDDMVMCVGDFNISAEASCFQEMRDAGFVELVLPPNSCASPADANRYLTTPTTVGNNWYDNFWMSRRCRAAMEDAWCFDFGGRDLSMRDANKLEYAGMRRSQRSDHYALLAQFKF